MIWPFALADSPLWRTTLRHVRYRTPPDVPAVNLRCAAFGDRSYTLATNVPARTVEVRRIPQGSGTHTKADLQ